MRELVDQAMAAMSEDPAGARETLDALGPKVWLRPADSDVLALGFALRSHASWRLGDGSRAAADLDQLANLDISADALLPVAPVLAVPGPVPVAGAARQLVDRLPGCGESACGHPTFVEAALAIVAASSEASAIGRWAQSAAPSAASCSLRLMAYRRVLALASTPQSALLDGDDERLRVARARVAYDLRDFKTVLALAPREHELAGRAALSLLLREPGIGGDVRDIAAAYAERESAARALVAEAESRHADAAIAWRNLGRIREAEEAQVLAEPTGAPGPNSVDVRVGWYAYGAGSAPRPSEGAAHPDNRANAEIGDARAWLRSIASGESADETMSGHPALKDMKTTLSRLGRVPNIAAAMLAAEEPIDLDAALQAFAVADATQGVPVREPWIEWADQHAQLPPIPMPTSPGQWLARPADVAAPSLGEIRVLPVELKLPVLAALVDRGHLGAISMAVGLLDRPNLAEVVPAGIPELASFTYAIAARRDAAHEVRRRASLLASAALANAASRGAWDVAIAGLAVRNVSASIADLPPDPQTLSPHEGFQVEREALNSFQANQARRAVGPVLHMLTGVELPIEVPDAVSDLYDEDDALAYLLLHAGRPDGARTAYLASSGDNSLLEAEIAAAMAERHLAGERPHAALGELASVPDPSDFILIDGEILERVASAVVRDGPIEGLDQAIEDAEVLQEHFNYIAEINTMCVELLLRRTRNRPGSAALDVADLEAAFEIDPDHPQLPRQLGYALVTRGMEIVELDAAAAVRDVDRATDIFMGDPDMIEIASRVATHAAVVFIRRRDRASADAALNVALAINPQNSDAYMARLSLRGGR